MNLKNHPAIKKYLSQAVKNIRKASLKDEIKEELLSHLELEVARLQKEDGLTVDQAVLAAIEQMGPADYLGKSFFDVYHYSWKFFLKIATSVAAVIAMIAIYQMTSAFNEVKTAQKKYVEQITPQVDDYIKDALEVDVAQLFTLTTRNKDAGELLNPSLIWMFGIDRARFPKNWGKLRSIEIPMRVSWDENYSIDDLSRRDREYVSAIDLSWMKHLMQYDHWDLYSHGPFERLTQKEKILWNGSYNDVVQPLKIPGFTQAAILHLSRGMHDKVPLVALQETHHLATLLYSTETIMGAREALRILDFENLFFEKAVDLGYLHDNDFKSFSTDLIKKARKVLDATEVFMGYNLLNDNSIFNKVFTQNFLPFGVCSAFLQTASVLRFEKGSLKFDGDVDSNYSKNFKTLLPQVTKNCRLTYFRKDLKMEDWLKNKWQDVLTARNFITDLKEGNIRPWKDLLFEKLVMSTPYLRNSFASFVAMQEQPFFPTDYKTSRGIIQLEREYYSSRYSTY